MKAENYQHIKINNELFFYSQTWELQDGKNKYFYLINDLTLFLFKSTLKKNSIESKAFLSRSIYTINS